MDTRYLNKKGFGKYIFFIGFVLLIISLFVLLYRDFSTKSVSKNTDLEVVFLDVGQGDAIYIEAPNGAQMIVDGGKGSVLSNAILPYINPFDKSIDYLVVTNPDKDHYEGFISLMDRYQIGMILQSGTRQDDITYSVFKNKVAEEDVPYEVVRKGDEIVLDKEAGVYATVLFPDRDVTNWERNDGSVVLLLTHGENQFLLMGDGTILTEGILVASGTDLDGVDVLKLGHHGSKTSTGWPIINATTPEYAIVSAAEYNSYGHPHKEVINRLTEYGSKILETKDGSIAFYSDGLTLRYEQ
ncbi:hypothetical protein H6790_02855 [Candidatus Nomurabacteria bacterium]|nr:hypothetical protein [Candidatus Nomurabacteria bacterium]MCB9820857.1 hypothetical protein [Candidatus Nomurabacteria bacterium]